LRGEEEMLPKVSILIPTYNRPELFHEALKSAMHQTYPNIEIIVCDNSDNGLSESIVKLYRGKYHPIKYFRNYRDLGPIKNQQKCLKLSIGEYINYLMDDLLHPEKIAKMMHYFQKHEDVILVTSHYQPIDGNGHHLPLNEITYKRLFAEDTIIDGFEFGNLILRDRINYIGAPTMVLFRKNALEEPFGVFAGRQAQNNVDVASWLNLLAKGKGVYMSETLSYFRVHPSQLTQLSSWNSFSKGTQDWNHHFIDAKQKGFLKD
jgi:glycosyltransferase involved in cell wall biosynthesis